MPARPSSSISATRRRTTTARQSTPSSASNPFVEVPDERKAFQLLDQQIRVLHSDKRLVALVGGTGFGKTWMGPHWIHRRARMLAEAGVKAPDFMAIGMQYERHIVNVMQATLLSFFNEIGEPYHLVTGKRITLPRLNDAVIMFGSAEKPASLEGPHLRGGVWMDEAGYMSRFAYEVAMRRSGYHADRGAQVYISTIPYIPGWLKNEVYIPWTQGADWLDWIHCRSVDNPNYSIEELKRAKATMRPDKFKTLYLGEFARPYGAIYPTPEDEELIFDWDQQFPDGMPEDWPCYAGHDFGVNAPTTGVWGRLDPDNDILYLVAEYERGDMTGLDHFNEWRALGLDFVDLAFGDPANPDVWMTMSQHGNYPVISGENSILYGIDCVYDRMVTGRLRIARGLKSLIDYRARYVWDTDARDEEQLLDRPKKPQEAEHLMDALRYLCAGIASEGLGAGPPEILARGRHL